MALLSVIRRWALRDRISIRAISRRTGLSRNTIRKYLRSGAVEPKFKVPDRPSKLDRFADKLAHWLKVEAGRSRKHKRTVKQLHADLVALGYEGSYGRVAAFVREWKADRQRVQQTTGRGVFVPLVFQPGEAFQFDWSEDWAILGGQRTRLQVAHFKLAHSRAFIVRAYPLQTHEMLFDAHEHAFRVLGGVPRRGIYDNMRTAVDRVGTGKARQVNARFAAMASHYLFDTEFCNPAAGWEKGQVEKNVQDARRRLWVPTPTFADLAALMEFHANNPDAPNKPVAIMMVYNNTPASVMALKKSGIKTPADLTGKKLGAPVFDAGRRAFPIFAKANSVGNVAWTAMDPPLRETMLVRGDVDAITGFTFTSLLNIEARGVKAADVTVLPYPDYGVKLYGNAIIATPKILKENPAAVKAFLAAFTKGAKDVITDPAKAIETVKARDGIINTALETRRLQLAIDTVINSADARTEGFGQVNGGRLSLMASQVSDAFNTKTRVKAEDVWNGSFLPSAKELDILPKGKK